MKQRLFAISFGLIALGTTLATGAARPAEHALAQPQSSPSTSPLPMPSTGASSSPGPGSSPNPGPTM